MDPHIIISPPKSPKFGKNVIAGIVVGVVLLSIPLGVYLVQQTQVFKPKALEEPAGLETSFGLGSLYNNCKLVYGDECNLIDPKPLRVGDIFKVQLVVRSDLEAAKVFAASINFPKELLEVTNIYTEDIPPQSESCGGLAGKKCAEGYTCSTPPEALDATGKCILSGTEGTFCKGLADTNTCAVGYSCIEKCGPPVSRDGDPAPGFSCTKNGEFDPVGRKRLNCPRCLAEDTKISTPKGEIPVQNVKEGDLVYSVNTNNQKITARVLRTVSLNVPENHQIINLKLKDGRSLQVSPNHPTADGKSADKLKAGDKYNDSIVVSVQKTKYTKDKTYDLLPDSDTGYYFANGILMGSTLKSQVLGIVASAQEVVPTSAPSGTGSGSSSTTYFIEKWIEKKYDNNTGKISIIGEAPAPGFKTNGTQSNLATIEFKAKAVGTANITFGADSSILSYSTNQNIPVIKRDTSIQILKGGVCEDIMPDCKEGESPITGDPNPNDPNKCPLKRCVPKSQVKGDGNKDGKIELVDLSILLSNYGNKRSELDYNNDEIINGLDYSSMVKYLIDSGIIRAEPS